MVASYFIFDPSRDYFVSVNRAGGAAPAATARAGVISGSIIFKIIMVL